MNYQEYKTGPSGAGFLFAVSISRAGCSHRTAPRLVWAAKPSCWAATIAAAGSTVRAAKIAAASIPCRAAITIPTADRTVRAAITTTTAKGSCFAAIVAAASSSGRAVTVGTANIPSWDTIIAAIYRILRTASRRITTRRLAGFVLLVAVLVNPVSTDFRVAWKTIRIQRGAVGAIKRAIIVVIRVATIHDAVMVEIRQAGKIHLDGG